MVIYEGVDPVTGRERRAWHPARTDRAEAERLAKKLGAAESERIDAVRSLTFGAYLTNQWLPAKKLHLATSTYRGYERNVVRHILPVLGRISIRRSPSAWVRSATSASSCSSRVDGPDYPAARAVLPASRKSAFQRPIDCSDTFSRRAASAIVCSPAITDNTIRVFFSTGIDGGLPMSATLLQD